MEKTFKLRLSAQDEKNLEELARYIQRTYNLPAPNRTEAIRVAIVVARDLFKLNHGD